MIIICIICISKNRGKNNASLKFKIFSKVHKIFFKLQPNNLYNKWYLCLPTDNGLILYTRGGNHTFVTPLDDIFYKEI